jgi:major vault protein
MILGPIDYVPSIEVEVIGIHNSLPLDQNEGVYVRNIRTGVVKTVIGEKYMLNEYEELWEK